MLELVTSVYFDYHVQCVNIFVLSRVWKPRKLAIREVGEGSLSMMIIGLNR